MADSDDGTELTPPLPPQEISGRYTSCLMSFNEHLAILNRSNSSSASTIAAKFEETRIERALKEYGRIRMWGEETRAILPAASRGSLDDTLRKDTELKDTVADILVKVEEQIRHATSIVRPDQSGDENVQDFPSEDSDSEESTEPSSDEDTDQEEEDATPSRVHPLLRLYRHIKEDIDSLYQVSLLTSRPGYSRKYIHSTGQKDWDPKISHYAAFDARYVEEKILDWRRHDVQAKQEPIATPDLIRNRMMTEDLPTHTKSLAQRLAKANTKRREQLMYWSRHPDQPPVTTPGSKPPATAEDDSTYSVKKLRKMPETKVEETILPEPPVDRESQGPKSTMTRDTFTTAVVSDVFGPSTEAGPERTIYAESTVGNKRSNRVPDIPSSASKHEFFRCPFCHLNLSSQQMQNRMEWKRHVFRDLRPYVCTFEGCQNPDKQYFKRHDWIYHETQMHRRRWVCVDHDTSFTSKALFVDHISGSHAESITAAQLPILIEMSERPTDEMKIVACPLCPDERQLALLQRHLAEHLESIALFVLPSIAGEEDEENSNSGLASGGTVSSRLYDLSQSTRLPSWDNVSNPDSSLFKHRTSSDSHRENNEQRELSLDVLDDGLDEVNVPETADQSWDGVTTKFVEAREGRSEEPPRFNEMVDLDDSDISDFQSFEIVGLVLRSFPLMMSALEHYEDAMSVSRKSSKQKSLFHAEITLAFASSTTMFESCCYELLRPLNLPFPPKQEQISVWASPELRMELEKRLGSEVDSFLSLVNGIYKRIVLFGRELGLTSNLQPPWVETNGSIDRKKRRKFSEERWLKKSSGFDLNKYVTIVGGIDSSVGMLTKLILKRTAGSVEKRKMGEELSYWEDIQDKAQSLFDSLNSRLDDCRRNHSHQAYLRMDVDKYYSGNEDTIRFAFIFALGMFSSETTDLVTEWRYIDIETSPHSRASERISPPSIPQTSSFPPSSNVPPSNIQNLCNALVKSHRHCIGFLDGQPYKHYVYSITNSDRTEQGFKMISLEDILLRHVSLKIKSSEKCELAFTLASAVLKLYNTSWLPSKWDSRDIFIAHTWTGRAILSHLYVGKVLGVANTSAAIPYVDMTETMFSLGVALLEISYMQPLLSLGTSDEVGMNHDTTKFLIATRLAESIDKRESINYAQAVRKCVGKFEMFASDTRDLVFREFNQQVVVPLKEDYDRYATSGEEV